MTRADRLALVALPAYWLVLFTATHYPRVPLPDQVPHGDKVVHFAAFALLALLYWRFAVALHRPLGPRFAWATAVVLIAYAALDEYLQQFVGRFTDLHDFFANAAGILAVVVVAELRRRRRSREPSVRP
ncbi:MAG: VanZ family protein [Myxococcota bacterium]|nr:VanZ family protein [Myxococcota bacterium]